MLQSIPRRRHLTHYFSSLTLAMATIPALIMACIFGHASITVAKSKSIPDAGLAGCSPTVPDSVPRASEM